MKYPLAVDVLQYMKLGDQKISHTKYTRLIYM